MIAGKPRCVVSTTSIGSTRPAEYYGNHGPHGRGAAPGDSDRVKAPGDAGIGLDSHTSRVIDLGGLDQAATEELGTAVAGAALDAESARWLYQRTAGNALFVGEIMRTLREGGRLEQVGDRVRIERGAGPRGVPLSLRALLGARIDALPTGPTGALEVRR